jgi:hypothetical protein
MSTDAASASIGDSTCASTLRYMPPALKELAEQLKHHRNTPEVLNELRVVYPKLNSFNTAVNKLRAYLITFEEHHPDYEGRMQELEQELIDTYKKSLGVDGSGGDQAVLNSLKFLYEFKGVPLRRQLHIVKKLRIGHMHTPSPILQDKVEAVPLLPDYIKSLQITPEEQASVKRSMEEAQDLRSTNVLTIDNPDGLVRSLTSVLRKRTSSTEDLCVAIALLTGRRTIEVLRLGSFATIKAYPRYLVFRGQAKTGLTTIASVTSDETRSYVIPVLCDGALLVRRIRDVQDQVQAQLGTESYANEKVNQKYSNKLGKAVKRLVHSSFRFHDLRTLYALITFEAFKPHTFSVNAWIKKVLGHAGLGMSTHYTRMHTGRVTPLNCPFPESF